MVGRRSFPCWVLVTFQGRTVKLQVGISFKHTSIFGSASLIYEYHHLDDGEAGGNKDQHMMQNNADKNVYDII